MTSVEQLDPETQFKVFWLQEYLFENGIDGIYFKAEMLDYLEDDADDDIQSEVNNELSNVTL